MPTKEGEPDESKALYLPQPYEDVPHTADLTLRVRGASSEVTLGRLILAMSDILVGGAALHTRGRATIGAEPGEPVLMAVDLLREVLYRFVTTGEAPRGCTVTRFDEERGAEAVLWLGAPQIGSTPGGADVKAVTYHDARFEPSGDGEWMARVTLDI